MPLRSFPKDIVFLAAKRTAFGTQMGTLKNVTSTDLAVHACKAAISQAGVKESDIGHIIMGNVIMSSSKDGAYMPRHVGLKCGLPIETPALGVNRLCGSGFQAVVNGAHELSLGMSDCVLVGGTENMSQSPHIIRGARQGAGIPLGAGELEDTLWASLTDSYAKTPMGITAENLASQYNITQQEVDEFSARSQHTAAEGQQNGAFVDEIAPMTVALSKKKSVTFEVDEHVRPQTTVEGFAKLPKVFKKDGVVHPGAASGICDGAAALVMSTMEFAEKHGIQPIGRLVSYGVAGCEPSIMGIGPAPAARTALARAGSSLDDMDLIEVNEAFAPQALAVQKELGFPMQKFNVDGGAIAIGHPLAASGARITTHLLYALKKRGLKKALGSACIGGGQGIALVLETM